MTWTTSSSDINPIESFWALLKQEMYSEGKRYLGDTEECLRAEVAAAQNIDSYQIMEGLCLLLIRRLAIFTDGLLISEIIICKCWVCLLLTLTGENKSDGTFFEFGVKLSTPQGCEVCYTCVCVELLALTFRSKYLPCEINQLTRVLVDFFFRYVMKKSTKDNCVLHPQAQECLS